MIKNLHIKNFQSHADTIMEFCPGINTITGASDSGKSSIIRALQLVCTNRPSGTAFIRHGEDICEVSLTTSEGNIIVRRKGKNINEYIMDGNVFEVPKTGVPDEIEKILDMNELNWQLQHDSPFLLSESSGEVSRMLNRITNLGAIDSSLSNANSRRLESIRRHEQETGELGRLKEELKKYDWIDECDKRLRLVERTEKLISRKRERGEGLERIVVYISRMRMELDDIRIPTPESVEKIRAIYNHGERLNIARNRLKSLVSALSALYLELDSVGLPENIGETLKKVEECGKVGKMVKRLFSLVDHLETLLEDTEENDKELKGLEKQMPDSCPLCGGQL